MPYDGAHDPEVQEIADKNDLTYEEADEIRKEIVEDTGPSDKYREEVNDKTIDKIIKN